MDHSIQKRDSYMTLGGHRGSEAAIVYENGGDIEALIQSSDILITRQKLKSKN